MSDTNHETAKEAVTSLIGKAEKSGHATEALQYSQAACNAANAIRILEDVRQAEKIK